MKEPEGSKGVRPYAQTPGRIQKLDPLEGSSTLTLKSISNQHWVFSLLDPPGGLGKKGT